MKTTKIQLAMSNEQLAMRKSYRRRLCASVFSVRNFLWFLFVLLLILSCNDPFTSPEVTAPSPEKGLFTLTIEGDNSHARTILPDEIDYEASNYSYQFEFTRTAPTAETLTPFTRTYAQLSNPIELEVGTYNLTVTLLNAINNAIARGTTTDIIISSTAATGTVTLKAIYGAGEGTFSWDITLASAITTGANALTQAKMEVAGPYPATATVATYYFIGAPATLGLNEYSTSLKRTVYLDSGSYYVTFTLSRTGFRDVVWYETLQVYQNLISHYDGVFSNEHFLKSIHTVTYHANNGTSAQDRTSFLDTDTITVKAKPATFEYADHIFDGWYVGSSPSATVVQPGDTYAGTASVDFFAKWLPIGYAELELELWLGEDGRILDTGSDGADFYDNLIISKNSIAGYGVLFTAAVKDDIYSSYQWYLNGKELAGETDRTVIINADTLDLNNGIHNLDVVVYRNNIPYSKRIVFKVYSNPFYVSNTSEWNEVVNLIKQWGAGDYIINVIKSFSVASSTATFGDAKGINVTIKGDYEISLSNSGILLRLYDEQTVIIEDTDLKGWDSNSGSLVFIPDGGKFIMKGNSSVSGNKGTSNGGGVYLQSGSPYFEMFDNSSVYGNTASSFGGGVYVGGGTFIMNDNSFIYGNSQLGNVGSSGGGGGGVYITGTDAHFSMKGGIIYGNNEGIYSNTVNPETGAIGAALMIGNFSGTNSTAKFGDGTDIGGSTIPRAISTTIRWPLVP